MAAIRMRWKDALAKSIRRQTSEISAEASHPACLPLRLNSAAPGSVATRSNSRPTRSSCQQIGHSSRRPHRRSQAARRRVSTAWACVRGKESGGEGGIRTPGTLSGTPVFKTGAINHSATSPGYSRLLQRLDCFPNGKRKPPQSLLVSLHQAGRGSVLRQESERLGVKLHYLGEMREEIRDAVIAWIGVIFVLHVLF